MKLVVVGGGIAGLTAARTARKESAAAGLDVGITVVEAADRLGGKLWTERVDGAALEWGPDSFLASKPEARELARELGLEVVPVQPAAARAFLLLSGRLRPFPAGLAMGVPTHVRALRDAVRSGIVGPGAAARAWADRVLPAEPDGHMEPSVEEMARRRLGRTWADLVVAPLIRGVYGVSPGEVSFFHAYPDAVGERSLISAMARRPRPTGPTFLSIRGGMGGLVEALAADLDGVEIRTACRAEALADESGRFAVTTEGGPVEADAVVLAVPAPAAGRLLGTVAPQASAELAGIRYSSSAVVLLGYEPASITRPLDGSGYLVAPEEDAVVAACSWLPAKWAHAASADRVWLRTVVTDSRPLELDDDALQDRVRAEVDRTMEASRPPADIRMLRWKHALPVFGLGHANRIATIRRSLPAGVALAGAYLEGFGVPDCIRTGREAARAVLGRP